MIKISRAPHCPQESVIAGHANQAETDHQHAGHRAALEGDIKRRRDTAARSFGCTDIGANRNIHANKTRRTREHRANQETEGGQPAEFRHKANSEEKDNADHGNRFVLSVEIRFGPLLDGLGNLLHTGIASRQRQNLPTGNPAIQNRQHSATKRQIQGCRHNSPSLN